MTKANRLLELISEAADKGETDVKAARKDIIKAAATIFGTPDEKIIDSMIEKAKSEAKDTEDLVQIVINMMRSKK